MRREGRKGKKNRGTDYRLMDHLTQIDLSLSLPLSLSLSPFLVLLEGKN